MYAATWSALLAIHAHNVVVPEIWRNGAGAAATKLAGVAPSGWDSTLWNLAYWYREA